VTGFIPFDDRTLAPLNVVPCIRLFVGDQDEVGHLDTMSELKAVLDKEGVNSSFTLLPGAGHFDIGNYIDMAAFWKELEAARPSG